MSDQFAMVPRAFSDRFFAAISAFYACDGQSWPPPVTWWQPGCLDGFAETVLFRYLHASGVPYRTYFMFEYFITRGVLGGWCTLGHQMFGDVCQILTSAGEFRSPFSGWVVDLYSSSACLEGVPACFVLSVIDGLTSACGWWRRQ